LTNGFEATAWAIPRLGSTDIVPIGVGAAAPDRPIAVLGPGTGLGVACLVPATAIAARPCGEGGHASLPNADDVVHARDMTIASAMPVQCMAERYNGCARPSYMHGPIRLPIDPLRHRRTL